MEANTLRPSGRGEHSHSRLPLGATRALVSQSDRKAYWAMGGNALGPSTASGSNGVWRPTATTSPSPEGPLGARLRACFLAIVPMVCPGPGAGNHLPQDRLHGHALAGGPARGPGIRVVGGGGGGVAEAGLGAGELGQGVGDAPTDQVPEDDQGLLVELAGALQVAADAGDAAELVVEVAEPAALPGPAEEG